MVTALHLVAVHFLLCLASFFGMLVVVLLEGLLERFLETRFVVEMRFVVFHF